MHDNIHPIHPNLSNPRPRHGLLAAFCVVLLLGGAALNGRAQASKEAPAPEKEPAALKALRYASLKSDRVYLRQGPGTDYPIAWVFQRAGLPVEVIGEFQAWRQVRDAGGSVGWVHNSLLSGRRTALVLPWEVKDGQTQVPVATLRDEDHERARAVAQVEAGVLASIISCDNGWCRVSIGDHRGYIEQAKLWGTYPNERIR
jgi:SH3-like domain-containing protein